MPIKPIVCLPALLLVANVAVADLATTVDQAINLDPYLKQSHAIEQSFYYQADAATGWMDPTVAIKAANIPFDLGVSKQPMSQLAISINQMLPNFAAQDLKQSELKQTGALEAIKRELRSRELTLAISQLWLDAIKWQQTLAQLEQFQPELERLQDLAELSFRQGLMQAGSDHILAAEALSLKLKQRQIMAQTQLDNALLAFTSFGLNADITPSTKPWPFSPINAELKVSAHPQIRLLIAQQQIKDTQSEFALSQDDMRFGLSASYGYRFDDAMGNARDDLISVGASFTMPLFSKSTASQQQLAVLSALESLVQQTELSERQLESKWQSILSNINYTQQALTLNKNQIKQQSQVLDSAIAAYTNNDGQFKPMIDAQLALFELELAQIDIQHRLQNQYAQQQFLLGNQQ